MRVAALFRYLLRLCRRLIPPEKAIFLVYIQIFAWLTLMSIYFCDRLKLYLEGIQLSLTLDKVEKLANIGLYFIAVYTLILSIYEINRRVKTSKGEVTVVFTIDNSLINIFQNGVIPSQKIKDFWTEIRQLHDYKGNDLASLPVPKNRLERLFTRISTKDDFSGQDAVFDHKIRKLMNGNSAWKLEETIESSKCLYEYGDNYDFAIKLNGKLCRLIFTSKSIFLFDYKFIYLRIVALPNPSKISGLSCNITFDTHSKDRYILPDIFNAEHSMSSKVRFTDRDTMHDLIPIGYSLSEPCLIIQNVEIEYFSDWVLKRKLTLRDYEYLAHDDVLCHLEE